MKKSTKTLSAAVAVASLGNLVVPAVTTFAAEQNTTDVEALVKKAEQTKQGEGMYKAWFEAQDAVIKAGQGAQYASRLSAIYDAIPYKALVKEIVDGYMSVKEGTDRTARKYYEIEAKVNKIQDEYKDQWDRDFLGHEIYVWADEILHNKDYAPVEEAIKVTLPALQKAGDYEKMAQVLADVQKHIDKLTGDNKDYANEQIKPFKDLVNEKLVAKVESVSAINAKQIEVKFTRAMDRSTVEKIDNYKVEALNSDDSDKTIQDVYLQDGKTAIITLDDATPLVNGYNYSVTISKDLKSTDGKFINEKFEGKILVNDETRPETSEIKTLAANLLQVTFTEPVKISSFSDNFQLVTVDKDGNELHDVLNPVVTGASLLSTSNGGRTVVVRLDNNLKQGSNYNLYVGGGNGIADYAGLKLTSEKHALTYTADKAITKVDSFSLLDQNTALVRFSKPVDKDNSNLSVYYNIDGVQGNKIETATTEFVDAQTVKVKFANIIPTGKKYFYVDGAKDFAGNAVQIGKFDVTVPEYKDAEVSSVTLKNKQTIEVQFNQDIDDKNSYVGDDTSLSHKNKVRANFALKDKDGNTVDIKDVALGTTNGKTDYSKRTITLYDDLGEGNNSLTIANIVDKLGRTVKTYATSISYSNATSLEAAFYQGAVEAESVADEDKTVAVLSIDESKSAIPSEESITNIKNWTVNTVYGAKNLSEVSGAKVTKVAGTTDLYMVSADKDAFNPAAGTTITLSGLTTNTGSLIAAKTITAGAKVNDMHTLTSVLGDQSLVNNEITMNLNTVIGSFNAGDFEVTAKKDVVENGNTNHVDVKPTDYTVSYANDTSKDAFKSKVVIKFNNNVKLTDGEPVVVSTKAKSTTADIFGRKIESGKSITVVDSTKATVENSYISEAGNKKSKEAKIVVNYNKSAAKLSAADFSVKTKSGKQLKVSGLSQNGTKVELTVKSLDDTLVLQNEEAVVSFAKKLSEGNVADETFETKSFRLTNVGFGAGADANKFDGDETITLTFNQKLNPDQDFSAFTKVNVANEGKTINTAFGAITNVNALVNGVSGDVAAKYVAKGNTVVITLTGFANATRPAAISDVASEFAVAPGLSTVQSIDGVGAINKFDADTFNVNNKIAPTDLVDFTDAEKIQNKKDLADVDADKAALTVSYDGTAATLTLPTTGSNGSAITWAEKTDDSNVATINGNTVTIVRSDADDTDETVTFTATIKKGSVTETKDFDITVKEAKAPTATVSAADSNSKTLKLNVEEVVDVDVVTGADTTWVGATKGLNSVTSTTDAEDGQKVKFTLTDKAGNVTTYTATYTAATTSWTIA